MGGSVVGSTVVVVEDDANLRDALAAALTFEGYNVRTFGRGKAVAAGIPFMPRPAVVILDLSLGDMSGGACLQLIRESRWADVPVLILSGWGHLDRFGLDAQALVSKSCDTEQLARAVDRLARSPAAAKRSNAAFGAVRTRPQNRTSSLSRAPLKRCER
jgi:two-component system OmpR family response regulator